MPPRIKYSKADLLHAAFTITRRRGIGAVNARAVANELGCSTQPIFRAFKSMGDVKKEMLRMAMDRYAAYITQSGAVAEKPYLRMGMAYLAFAREEPELFRLLYMRDRAGEAAWDGTQDKTIGFVIDLVMRRTGLTRAQAEQFHEHMWVFVHGLGAMIATRFAEITEERAEKMLKEEYAAMRMLYGLPAPEDE